jgi:hypothetical protein
MKFYLGALVLWTGLAVIGQFVDAAVGNAAGRVHGGGGVWLVGGGDVAPNGWRGR